MSDPAILAKLGSRIKELRIRQNLQQGEMASRAGVSLFTISKIEKGEPVNMTMFLKVLRTLNLLENLDQLVPEPPISPLLLRKLKGKTKIRVRKNKKEGYE